MITKRYMVFEWSEYDNPAPFDCLSRTFDDDKEAVEYATKTGEKDDNGNKLYCVFDRITGNFLKA